MKTLPTLTSLLLALGASSAARGEIIISNFSAGVGVGTAFGGGASTQYKAYGFTMGATSFQLDDVSLSFNFPNASPVPVVSIWDGATLPTNQLIVLDNPAILTGPADYVFTSGTPFTLNANTTYWVHVVSSPTNGVAFTWDGTTPSTDPTGANASGIGYIFNGNTSTLRNRLEVNGTSGSGSLGTPYCTPAVANTSGGPAAIGASGSVVVASNDVTLQASGMPQSQFGFFLTSMSQGMVPNPGGSNGVLCLGGTIGRYVAGGQIKNSGSGGAFDLVLDLAQTPAGSMFVSIAAGETWNFQAWFRDIGPMGQPQSNFTHGLARYCQILWMKNLSITRRP